MTPSLPVVEAGDHGVPVTECTFFLKVVVRSSLLVSKDNLLYAYGVCGQDVGGGTGHGHNGHWCSVWAVPA